MCTCIHSYSHTNDNWTDVESHESIYRFYIVCKKVKIFSLSNIFRYVFYVSQQNMAENMVCRDNWTVVGHCWFTHEVGHVVGHMIMVMIIDHVGSHLVITLVKCLKGLKSHYFCTNSGGSHSLTQQGLV